MLHNALQYGLGGLTVVCIAAALLLRSKRTPFVCAALAAAFAAASAHYNVFWATLLFALMAFWALFTATNMIDLSWRVKTGFVLALAVGAGFAIYPTYHDERYGRTEYTADTPPEVQADLEAKAKRGDLGVSLWLQKNIPFRLVRGLDLKGGLRLVYTVEVDKAIEDKRDHYYDEVRQALAHAYGFAPDKEKSATIEQLAKLPTKVKIEKSKEQAGVFVVNFADPKDSAVVNDEFLKKFLHELSILRSPDQKKITFRINSTVESSIRDKAVTQAKETVHRRIDTLGLKEASVTVRDEDIIIEMPGDDDKAFAEIRETISQTARLEFKMVDDNVDFFEPIARTAKPEDLPKRLDFVPESAPVGPGRQKVVHYAAIKKIGKEDLNATLKRLREWLSTLQVDPDHEIGVGKLQEFNEDSEQFEDVGWRTYYLYSKAEVTGDMVRDAQANNQQSDRGVSGWVVNMELTPVGADRFEDVTGKNVMRRFAIILDNKVESAPRILNKIGGGHCQITMGSSNPDEQLIEAKKLEIVLKSGALPAPIAPSNEQRIGPSLGKDALSLGLKGAGSGALLVLVFMLVYYSRAGMIANVAVLFNLVLQVAILAMFGASMTLPGIAGLVLTIGIAVDANVLINERIREELRHGKTPRTAVDIGYDKAFSAIIDGHITTLISGLILWQYGTGPIKGFAVTLIVGIAASLFTGVVCTRLMFDWAVRHRKVTKLHLG